MSNEKDIIEAHKYSSNHQKNIINDKTCGCFYCLKTFPPSQIEVWINDIEGTALCPNCGIDSVIGESSGFPITHEFLEKMKKYWF
jgi:hypothetical protein